MDRFPGIRRWAAVISVCVLVATTLMRGFGKVNEANALEQIATVAGMMVTDPAMAAAVVAGSTVSLKLGRMVAAAWRGESK